jgi:hypothetical protein
LRPPSPIRRLSAPAIARRDEGTNESPAIERWALSTLPPIGNILEKGAGFRPSARPGSRRFAQRGASPGTSTA